LKLTAARGKLAARPQLNPVFGGPSVVLRSVEK